MWNSTVEIKSPTQSWKSPPIFEKFLKTTLIFSKPFARRTEENRENQEFRLGNSGKSRNYFLKDSQRCHPVATVLFVV